MIFYLGKVLQAVLFPPGLVILAIVIAAYPLRRTARPVAIALAVVAAVLYVMSITPTRVLVTAPLENAYRPLVGDPKADAIVVLGGGAVGGSDVAGADSMTAATANRLLAAYDIYRRIHVPMVLSGGNPLGRSTISEAQLMRRQLVALGVPDVDILAEERSRSTAENGGFVAEVARARGFRRIVLVTSAMHMPRSVRVFRHFGLQVAAAPTDYSGTPSRFDMAMLLPSASGLAGVDAALHEHFGTLYYRLAYGI